MRTEQGPVEPQLGGIVDSIERENHIVRLIECRSLENLLVIVDFLLQWLVKLGIKIGVRIGEFARPVIGKLYRSWTVYGDLLFAIQT